MLQRYIASDRERAAARLRLLEMNALGESERIDPNFPTMGPWLKIHNPGIIRGHPEWRWDAPHFLAMQALLNRVTSGEIKWARFQIPIRHAKSEHNTIAYAAYRLHRDPRTRIGIVSYDQPQANTFSIQIRRFVEELGIKLSSEVNAASKWETAEGGGVIAIGVHGGFSSKGFDLVIIDDPIGRRADAESVASRSAIWTSITDNILARAEPKTSYIFTMSRWNTDDPAARIDRQFPGWWVTLDLPGEAEENDPLGRAVGDPLWPEERGIEWLKQQRVVLLEYGFASQIQGRPRPKMGGMFKWDNWQLLEAVPTSGLLIRYWDMAGTKSKGESHDPDFTAGVLARQLPEPKDGLGSGLGKQTSIAHVCKFRLEVGERDAKIVEQARLDIQKYGMGIIYWFERQAGIGGEEATENLMRKVRNLGIACFAESAPAASKPERARPLASAVVSQDVFLEPDDVIEPWHDSLRLEAADFPNGAHDDQVDAAAGAYNKLNVAESFVWHTQM